MSWDKTAAVSYAKSHAGAHSQSRCAEFTRKAILAGGVLLGNTNHAKDYGPMLKNAGFVPIGAYESPQAGDVIVIQPYSGGNPSGHMAISDNATCGQALVTGQQNRPISSTGNSDESLLFFSTCPAALQLLHAPARQHRRR